VRFAIIYSNKECFYVVILVFERRDINLHIKNRIFNTMEKAIDIANRLISLSEPEFGDSITNLKLQKLLYYTQGFHLALYGERFFEEDIHAWQYGPVVPIIYDAFKQKGAEPILLAPETKYKTFNEDQEDLLKEIYSVYGQFSALKLMNMTHEESPWLSTPQAEVITDEKLLDHFNKFTSSDGEGE